MRERAFIERLMPGFDPGSLLRKGTGCGDCNRSGYSGRVGVYELLQMDDQLSHALIGGSSVEFASVAQGKIGKATLVRHALQRALDGETTVSEAMRVAAAAQG